METTIGAPDHKGNFRRLLDYFPAIRDSFERSGNDWNQIRDENQKHIASFIDEASLLFGAGELQDLLPRDFGALTDATKIDTLKNLCIYYHSNVVANPDSSVEEKAESYQRLIPAMFSKRHIQEPIDRMPGFHEGKKDAMLQDISMVDHELVLQISNSLINRQAVKIVASLMNQNGLWQLEGEQIDELCGCFPAQKKDETDDEYLKRILSLGKTAEIPGKDREDVNKLLEEVTMMLMVQREIESGLKKRNKATPVCNTRYDRNVENIATNICQEISHLSKRENIQKVPPEGRERVGIPEKIGNINEIVAIVDGNPQIKAVSFDLMDTVIYWNNFRRTRQSEFFDQAIRVLNKNGISISIEEFSKIHGISYDPVEIRGIWYQMRKDSFVSDDGYELRFKQLMEAVLREVYKQKGRPVKDKEIARISRELEEAYVQTEAKTVLPMPFAKETLQELKRRGIKIILLSNAIEDENAIKKYLQKAGLLEYFEQINVSAEVGYQKHPRSTRFFDHMVKNSGHHPGEIIHVGDNPHADFEGGRNAGLHAVHYQPNRDIENVINGRKRNYRQGLKEKESLTDDLAIKRQLEFEHKMDAEKIPPNERDELKKLAARMYQVSRDYYSPATMGFAVELLEDLQKDPNRLNICTGRDSLIVFIQQQLLRRKFKDRFGNIDYRRIKYLPISRKLIGGSASLSSEWRSTMAMEKPWIITEDNDKLERYLASADFDKYETVSLIDNGFSGTSQNELQRKFPSKDIHGKYLAVRKSKSDEKKKGYFVGLDKSTRSYDPSHGSQFGSRYKQLFEWRTMWMIEDFFNGIQTSAEHFTGKELIRPDGTVIPKTNLRKLGGNLHERKRKLLKYAAVVGMIDAVEVHGENVCANPTVGAQERTDKFMQWVNSVMLRGADRDWVGDDKRSTPRLEEDAKTDIDARLLQYLWRGHDLHGKH